MGIHLDFVWKLIINDMGNVIDIDTPRRYIGSDQHLYLLFSKGVHDQITLVLT